MRLTEICLYNDCHGLLMLRVNISDITIVAVKEVDNCFIIHDIKKSEAINLLENSLLDDHWYIGTHV